MRRADQHRNQLIRTIAWALLVLVVVGAGIIYWQAAAPLTDAKKSAVAMAEKYGKLKSTSAFYWYNRQQTYYTVAGKNQANQSVYVMVAQKGGHINIYQQSSGITSQQAQQTVKSSQHPRKIVKTAFGKWKKQAVWEVTYVNKNGRMCYTLLSFKNGSLVKTIQNI
ncbi:MAG: DUF5590 domain-containing protein [Liquorilactobacillus nagelii]|uniref:Cell wall elongation regulator TseB-like domain-containing protein n=1 Tax=Liquorilactobacillus nagelii TaxID=82688 RepID=A0A3Q8CBK2_9LACO|nr:DUF5590 domain-containing protein [Liquorilactobacillus nagelii]AUJ31837.1 hypothetical protein BSQ50_04230 [Liquorilactobacillus nagelii]MCC7615784.1 hypothetical protein [Liquorilactobacillus nagelii]MCP9314090.1 DUF5590 domain-containing protein [Liquorilactobacillus nagelii]